jgi:transketolase
MNDIIKKIITTSYLCKEGHIASSLSVLDILFVLYKDILKLESEDRDRLILSKGHASLGLYAVLDHFNLLEENLSNFGKFNSKLGGHPSDKTKFVEASTGSLGHGLAIGVGLAMGYKILNYINNIYVIIGDGESNEGTIWESALLASHHKLNNLYCIMDFNRSNDRAIKIDNVMRKFDSFNWDCIEINGHNYDEIKMSLQSISQKPTFILANTIKGKGVKMMENNPEWHHRFPNEDEYNNILFDL